MAALRTARTFSVGICRLPRQRHRGSSRPQTRPSGASPIAPIFHRAMCHPVQRRRPVVAPSPASHGGRCACQWCRTGSCFHTLGPVSLSPCRSCATLPRLAAKRSTGHMRNAFLVSRLVGLQISHSSPAARPTTTSRSRLSAFAQPHTAEATQDARGQVVAANRSTSPLDSTVPIHSLAKTVSAKVPAPNTVPFPFARIALDPPPVPATRPPRSACLLGHNLVRHPTLTRNAIAVLVPEEAEPLRPIPCLAQRRGHRTFCPSAASQSVSPSHLNWRVPASYTHKHRARPRTFSLSAQCQSRCSPVAGDITLRAPPPHGNRPRHRA
jgi:hypothetical protein